jgi:dsRNA-specific ribonuclease
VKKSLIRKSVFLEKLKESAASVMPIVLIVGVLCLIWVPVDNDLMLAFLIGAVFLDGGYEATRGVVLRLLEDGFRDVREGRMLVTDYKSALQEVLQAEGMSAGEIHYVDAGEKGPDHDKVFTVKLIINGREEAEGEGKSKKQAQQNAAEAALSRRRHAI